MKPRKAMERRSNSKASTTMLATPLGACQASVSTDYGPGMAI